MNRIIIICAILATFLLTGCGAVMDIAGDLTGRGHVSSRPGRTTTTASIPSDQGAPPAELGTYGPKTNPYTVMGKRYYPLQTANGYDVVGTASWYGSENHGLQTASGSIYNMYSMSAAHKTLPLGTIVRVENLENGRNVELLVNDRGPFIGERIIDLSYGAAKRIGFDAKGLARVRVVAIGDAYADKTYLAASQPTRPVAHTNTSSTPLPPSDSFYVQVGAYSQQANAAEVRNALIRNGFAGTRIETKGAGGRVLHLVKAGPFANKTQADQALARLQTAYPSSFVASL